MTYRPDAAPQLEVEVEMESKAAGPAQRASPALPSKVYDCKGAVVHLQDMLRAGVVEIQGGDGRSAYCFFQVNSHFFNKLIYVESLFVD